MITVRPERPEDVATIREVNIAAFGRPGHPTDEADMADALRAHGKALLSLVAELDGVIVGHVMFSPLTVEMANGDRRIEAALGPIGVLPAYQRQGVGTELIQAGLEACRLLGFGCVALLGPRAYYSRFGFRPASEFGLVYATPLEHPGAFQVVELWQGALQGVSGIAHEAEELG